MPEVLIRCPNTRKLLATGIALDLDCFHRTELKEMAVFCPFCGRQHRWEKKDAFLRE